MGDLIPLFPLGSPLFPGVVLPLQVFEPRYRVLVQDLLALPEDGDRRFFGVVAIRQGWEVERVAPAEALYDVGCTARVQVVRPQPDGGFRLVTVGGDRFRLLDVLVGDAAGEDAGSAPPYLRAEVEWLADEEAAEEAAGDQEQVLGGPPAAGLDEGLVAEAARGSLGLLERGVGRLFTRYVTAVAGLQTGREETAVAGEAEELSGAATLLDAVAGDPRALSYLVASAALLTTEDRQALLAESATRRRLLTETRMLRRELTLLETVGAVPAPLQQFAGPLSLN
ncbi:LON peptidase substrate-binding domain-containing protein [Geodermatophilus normandii]|uniref:LON peptidase substrate-binding domain-containing protein n=1 Tax=Geodermatophilus normandii TaxID=1137989 RepID=A0A6P0GKN4_9ACTN|nr:LON peptidase substrate-binding domain-containing protein [Geodermatophilus normandii]